MRTQNPFRERVAMPATIVIPIIAMLVIATSTVATFVGAAMALPRGFTAVVVTCATLLVVLFMPALAVFGTLRGWKASPVFATLVGAWAATQLVYFTDPLSLVIGAAGVAILVTVWLPSARAYREARRRVLSS